MILDNFVGDITPFALVAADACLANTRGQSIFGTPSTGGRLKKELKRLVEEVGKFRAVLKVVMARASTLRLESTSLKGAHGGKGPQKSVRAHPFINLEEMRVFVHPTKKRLQFACVMPDVSPSISSSSKVLRLHSYSEGNDGSPKISSAGRELENGVGPFPALARAFRKHTEGIGNKGAYGCAPQPYPFASGPAWGHAERTIFDKSVRNHRGNLNCAMAQYQSFSPVALRPSEQVKLRG